MARLLGPVHVLGILFVIGLAACATRPRAIQVGPSALVTATTGAIRGQVLRDEEGSPLANALVVALEEPPVAGSTPSDDAHAVYATSDARGIYDLGPLSPGVYRLLIYHQGARAVRRWLPVQARKTTYVYVRIPRVRGGERADALVRGGSR